MRKTNLPLLLAAGLLAALPLVADNACAAVSDVYETNQGMVIRFHGTPVTGITFAEGLSNPKGLAFDGNGHLFVADASAGSIFRFTLDGVGVTFAQNFNSPVGVTFDVQGNLFVGESGSGNIIEIAVNNTRSTYASGLGAPAGLAFSGDGSLYVADFSGGHIFKIAPDGTKTTFASGLSFPAGLAIDNSNNLFVADSGTGTIFKFTSDGTRTTFATNLGRPYGLAFEPTGGLVVADNSNGTTYRYTPDGTQSVIFSSDFNTPQFVAVEPAPHQLLNMSTRGFVTGGDHVLIAGFIIGGVGPVGTTVVVRAIGPSLASVGVPDPLGDPLLGVRDSNGTLISFNDDWADAPPDQRVSGDLAPTNSHESALQLVLHGGAYTAIVNSANNGTGTALVEVYSIP
jgi:sugar lactone lactonase YvrE